MRFLFLRIFLFFHLFCVRSRVLSVIDYGSVGLRLWFYSLGSSFFLPDSLAGGALLGDGSCNHLHHGLLFYGDGVGR
ncbi:MAG: hypothetical protein PSN37_02865 [Alphaproteobacteria bacterium]|nr:hypothetical protein [Alphaproteobacteria bacterium]